jgi:putative cell wall-binding protein
LLRKTIAVLATTAAVLAASALPASAADTLLTRVQGEDRFATSIELSKRNFTGGVDSAFVATGDSYADALSAGAAAGARGGPVLLVPSKATTLSNAMVVELKRLAPKRVVIAGGFSSVSTEVEAALKAQVGNVTRYAGLDRYDTAAKVMKGEFKGYRGPVYVATGLNFPDGLSGASAAAAFKAPLVLVPGSSVPDSVSSVLRDGSVTATEFRILGGTTTVTRGVEQELRATGVQATATRYAGADRYETSAMVAKSMGSRRTFFLATGRNFPDALSASAASGQNAGVVLLTEPTCLPGATASYLKGALASQDSVVVLVGGTTTVSDAFTKGGKVDLTKTC